MNTQPYFPEYDGDTSGPYYTRRSLYRADDKRMIGLEKAQKKKTMWCELGFFSVLLTALVLWFCFSL